LKELKPKIVAGAVTSKRLADKQELEVFRARGKAAAERARLSRTALIYTGLERAFSNNLARLSAMPELDTRAKTLRRHIELKVPETYGLARLPDISTVRDFVVARAEATKN